MQQGGPCQPGEYNQAEREEKNPESHKQAVPNCKCWSVPRAGPQKMSRLWYPGRVFSQGILGAKTQGKESTIFVAKFNQVDCLVLVQGSRSKVVRDRVTKADGIHMVGALNTRQRDLDWTIYHEEPVVFLWWDFFFFFFWLDFKELSLRILPSLPFHSGQLSSCYLLYLQNVMLHSSFYSPS